MSDESLFDKIVAMAAKLDQLPTTRYVIRANETAQEHIRILVGLGLLKPRIVDGQEIVHLDDIIAADKMLESL